MNKKLKNSNQERAIFYILLGAFIITEIIDFLLDKSLGKSILHSLLQLFLFSLLFIITYRLFIKYSNRKIKKLVPENLMEILNIINNSRKKGVIINQRKLRELLKITKPTLKKRVEALLELKYISFEEKGNNRYLTLTNLGKSIIE